VCGLFPYRVVSWSSEHCGCSRAWHRGHGQVDGHRSEKSGKMPKPTTGHGGPHTSVSSTALPLPPASDSVLEWSYATATHLFLPHLRFQNSKPPFLTLSSPRGGARDLEAVAVASRNPGGIHWKNPRVGDGRILSLPVLGRAGEASIRSTIPCLFPSSSSSTAPHSAGRWGDFLLYLLATRAPLPLLLVPVARCFSILNAGGHRGRGCGLWSS